MNKKSKNILSLIIVLAIVGIGVGYAALSQQLNLNGTATLSSKSSWNVHFIESQCTVDATSSTAIDKENATMSASGQTGTFSAKLNPGEKVVYDVYIANSGSIPASYQNYTISDKFTGDAEAVNAMTCTVDVDDDENGLFPVLYGGEERKHHFTVTLECRSDINSLPTTDKTAQCTVTFNYQQGTASEMDDEYDPT